MREEPGASDDLGDDVAGQTGDEGVTPWRPPGGAGQDSDCPLSATTEVFASLEEDTELGFSAADILELAAGKHEARVHWNARPVMYDFLDYALVVTPGDLDEPLRLELGHDGSAPRYRARMLANLVPDAGTPEYCRGQLELGVTVELHSESGALDERWRGTLTASAPSEAVVLLQAPTWRGRLPRQPDRDEGHFLNAQEGSLNVIDANDPGSVLAWVDLALRFRSGAVDGGVNGWVQDSRGGAFLLPQGPDNSRGTAWIGVVGDGFYYRLGAVE